jgi:hypothetical protein
MRRRSALTLWFGLAAFGCHSHADENAKAKARIFQRAEDEAPPAGPAPIDVSALGGSAEMQDRVLGMTEADARDRAGSFRLRAKLQLRFEGPGQHLALEEERLVEQAKDGNLHARIADSDGNGMEVLSVGGKDYARSRYGPYIARDRDSELSEHADETFGALRTLYELADRGLQLRGLGPSQGCNRFEISAGQPRPLPTPPRFTGRLDADTTHRFQFVYGRHLAGASGELCINAMGLPVSARVSMHWTASGDAGIGQVRADLSETISDVGADVRILPPENPAPEPHRPRGPFATLSKFGFVAKPDGGDE